MVKYNIIINFSKTPKMSSNPNFQTNNLIIRRLLLPFRSRVANHRYSEQSFPISGNTLTFWTLAFHESEADEFAQLFNHEMTSGQSVVCVCLPNGQDFYLTGGFIDRPFIAGVFGDIVVVQVREKVYCLSISRELDIEHSFTLSKPLGLYHSASYDGDFIEIYYYPADNISVDINDDYAIPDKEVFHLVNW